MAKKNKSVVLKEHNNVILKKQKKIVGNVLIIGVMSFSLLLTACQPTPEKNVVVGRQIESYVSRTDEDQTENVKSNSKEFKRVNAPKHVTSDAVPYKKITIAEDAEVIVPETTAYPVTEVSKRVFSIDDIKNMMTEMTGATTFYSDWRFNKNEYLEQLTFAKENLGKEGIDQNYINYLENQFKTAPEQVDNPLLDFDKLPSDKYIYVYMNSDDGRISNVLFTKEQNSFSYTRNILQNFVSQRITEPHEWEIPREPNISETDALAIAENWAEKLNVDLKLRSSELCSVTENSMQIGTGWSFIFTREISNMQTDYQFFPSAISLSSLPSIAAPWEQEIFRVVVDKDGVAMLTWNGASNVNKTLSENEPLLDLSEIQERTINQLNFNIGDNLLEGLTADYTITKYELGIGMISVKDQPDLGWYIPTWYVTYEYTSEGGTVFREQIIFNAIDGSYIEPRVTNEFLMSTEE